MVLVKLNDYLEELLLNKYDFLFGLMIPSTYNGILSEIGEVTEVQHLQKSMMRNTVRRHWLD